MDQQKQAEDANWWSDSAAPGRRLTTVSNWYAKIWMN